jgi:hypothetical protein
MGGFEYASFLSSFFDSIFDNSFLVFDGPVEVRHPSKQFVLKASWRLGSKVVSFRGSRQPGPTPSQRHGLAR